MRAARAPAAAGARRTESRRALVVADPARALRTVLRVDDFSADFFFCAPVFAIGFLAAGLALAPATVLAASATLLSGCNIVKPNKAATSKERGVMAEYAT